jgi:trigger factor
MQLSQQGLDIKRLFTPDTVPQLRERSRPEAVNRIKRTLALGEVAKRESIKVEPEAIEARAKELMAQYTDQDVDPARVREVVEEDLLKEKIVGWLEEHSTLELVPEGSLSQSAESSESPESPGNEEDEPAIAVTAEVVDEATDATQPDVEASA